MKVCDQVSFRKAVVNGTANSLAANSSFKEFVGIQGIDSACHLITGHFKWVALNEYYDFYESMNNDFGLGITLGEHLDITLTREALEVLKVKGVL